MPTLPSVPNTARVRVMIQAANGHQCFNVHHYSWTGGPAAVGDMQALADSVYAVYAGRWIPAMDPAFTLKFAEAVDLSSPSGVGATHQADTAGAGGANSSDVLAAQINWKIARRYRGGKPKSYLPGVPNPTTLENDVIQASTLGSLDALATHLISDPAAAAYPNITTVHKTNVSYYEGFHNVTLPSGRQVSRPNLRAVPVVDPVVGFTHRVVFAVQRRRRTSF